MDTSEAYVKMCDCPEIQGQRPKGDGWRHWGDDGDVVFVRHDDDGMDHAFRSGPSVVWNGLLPTTGYHNWRENWASVRDVEVVWLPRQDQLQEMVGYGPPSEVHLIHDLMELRYGPVDENGEYEIGETVFDTWEQLWLALVMHHKHNKTWNGATWA